MLIEKIEQYKEKILTVAFSTLSIIVCALITSGLRFEWEVFTDWSFYVKTEIRYVIMIICFNSFKNDYIRAEKIRESSKYLTAKKIVNKYTKTIRAQKLEKIVEEQAKIETENRRIDACDRLLNKYTYGLKYNPNSNDIDFGAYENESNFFEKKHFKKRIEKKVKKCIYKVLNNDVDYISVNAYELLTGYKNGNTKCSDMQMSVNELAENAKENGKKSIIFICSALVLGLIAWDNINAASFWVMICTHLLTIIGALISGISTGYQRIETLTQIELNRASFFNQFIDTIE